MLYIVLPSKVEELPTHDDTLCNSIHTP